jgi:hypothetical protein
VVGNCSNIVCMSIVKAMRQLTLYCKIEWTETWSFARIWFNIPRSGGNEKRRSSSFNDEGKFYLVQCAKFPQQIGHVEDNPTSSYCAWLHIFLFAIPGIAIQLRSTWVLCGNSEETTLCHSKIDGLATDAPGTLHKEWQRRVNHPISHYC